MAFGQGVHQHAVLEADADVLWLLAAACKCRVAFALRMHEWLCSTPIHALSLLPHGGGGGGGRSGQDAHTLTYARTHANS